MEDYRSFVVENRLKVASCVETAPSDREFSAVSLLQAEFKCEGDAGARFGDRQMDALRSESGETVGFYLRPFLNDPGLVFVGDISAAALSPALSVLPAETIVLPKRSSFGFIFSTIEVEKKRGAKDPDEMALRSPSMSIDKFRKKLGEAAPGVLFIDVREAFEFQKGRIPGTLNIPLSELGLFLPVLAQAKRVYFTCLGGRRSEMAAQTLNYLGLDAMNVQGGFQAWLQAELPIEL